MSTDASRSSAHTLTSSTATPGEADPSQAGTFRIRFAEFDSAATSLEQVAICAKSVMQEVMRLTSFCGDVKRTSVAMSLLASDGPMVLGGFVSMAEDLHKGSHRGLAAAQRTSAHVQALMDSLDQASTALTEMSAGLDMNASCVAHPRSRGKDASGAALSP